MQFKLNATNSKKPYRKLIYIIGAALLIGSFAVFGYMQTREKPRETESTRETTESDRSVGNIPTFEAETEGQTVDIPTNVEPDSIKNYELLTENEQYKIRKLGNQYTITLYAIINNPNQRDMYVDQLRDYKQNALAYLQQQGVNTNTANIIYEPNEATDL